jgi:hypothetical protein
MNDMVNKMLEELILTGAVEVAAVNENGQFMYSFTEKLAEVNPSLHRDINNHFYSTVMSLWTKGFVNVDKMDTLDPVVTLSEKTKNKQGFEELNEHEMVVLDNIIRQFSKDQ